MRSNRCCGPTPLPSIYPTICGSGAQRNDIGGPHHWRPLDQEVSVNVDTPRSTTSQSRPTRQARSGTAARPKEPMCRPPGGPATGSEGSGNGGSGGSGCRPPTLALRPRRSRPKATKQHQPPRRRPGIPHRQFRANTASSLNRPGTVRAYRHRQLRGFRGARPPGLILRATAKVAKATKQHQPPRLRGKDSNLRKGLQRPSSCLARRPRNGALASDFTRGATAPWRGRAA
jgi:hypothetical protein